MFRLTNLLFRSNLDTERQNMDSTHQTKILVEKFRFINGFNSSLKNSLIPSVLKKTCTLPCTLAACTLNDLYVDIQYCTPYKKIIQGNFKWRIFLSAVVDLTKCDMTMESKLW